MTMTWLPEASWVDVTPAASLTWEDKDASAYIPASASGVIVQSFQTSTSSGFCQRQNGSTDVTYSGTSYANNTQWCICGLDANRIFEVKKQGFTAGAYMKVVGYTQDEMVWFTNAPRIDIGATSTWEDMDISALVSSDAIAALTSRYGSSTSVENLRPNGSADNRILNQLAQYQWGVIVLDAGPTKIVEQYLTNANSRVYLKGYLRAGFVGNINFTNLVFGTVGSFADLTTLPVGAIGAAIQVIQTTGGYIGWLYTLRPKGETFALQSKAQGLWGLIAGDANRIVEAYQSNAAVDFYLAGYFTDVPDVFADTPRVDDLPWTPPVGQSDATGITLTSYFAPFERKLEVGPLPALRLLRR